MGRKLSGSVRILRNADGAPQWHAKWTRADGTRSPWMPIDPNIRLDDLAGARALAARLAPKVRQASMNDGKGETVADYAKRWLDNREGRVASLRDDRSRMRDHVLPKLGTLVARSFTRDDVETLRDDLDAKISKGELAWKTAGSVWTLVTSLCRDMVNAKKRELRTREDDPSRDVKPPERGNRKAKQYLYPSEFLRLVSCETVPLRWRRAVAIAVYTYARDGELRALRWNGGDVDLEHGVLSITRAWSRTTGKEKPTKSGETRRLAIEANLLPLLRSMHAEKQGKGTVLSVHELHMARPLRRFLKRAGVTQRPELHKGSPTRKPLTWHDLRATGITWMAVRGDDPLKIKQRAGHATFSTTEIYIREAEAVREGFGEVFPKLPESLLGIAPNRPGAIQNSRSSQKQAVSRAGHGGRTREENAQSTENLAVESIAASPELPAFTTTRDHSKPVTTSQGTEPTIAELERAIVDAIHLGAVDVARVLAERLRARESKDGQSSMPLAH